MNTDFPENLFPPKNSLLYEYKLECGKNLCCKKSIFFCGIARNVGHVLQKNIDRLHRTGKLFKEYKIFIYENDSDDDTKKILEKNKSENLDFISESREDRNYKENINNGKDIWHYDRCVILAQCRNKYISYIDKNIEYDYVCVLDFDVLGGWSYDGILHSIFILELEKNIACVSAYGVLSDRYNTKTIEENLKNLIMYDSFAFRPLGWKNGMHLLSMATFNNITFNRDDNPVEVESNFGGMAIYKTTTIKNKSYGAKEWSHGYVDPDHVVFNRQLRQEGYKIILDPSMIVSYSNHKYSIGDSC